MPDYVFLTYDRADRSYVDSLVRRLVAEGIPYWIDHETEFDTSAVFEQLAGAAAVVVVVTPRAMASPRVARALRQARELRLPILPLVRRRATRPDPAARETADEAADEAAREAADEARNEAVGIAAEAEDVTTGGMPSPAFYDRIRAYTGSPRPSEATDAWQPRTRLPHRLGPLAKTPAETWAVRALLAATIVLAAAGIFGGNWNLFLVFPAFGIPDLLFAWFRWRRFRRPGRWSTDVRATILLTGLTFYLAFAAAAKLSGSSSLFLLAGIPAAIVLSLAAAGVWISRAIRDRPRGPEQSRDP
jgi:hypothetical protein